jgi:hemoglobin
MRDAFWEAAHLYNDGYHARSAAYFQATLKSLIPLLDHRPELQEDIRRRLVVADREQNMAERPWKMRDVMIHVWRQVNQMPKVVGEDIMAARNLWERLGREKGVRKIVDEWIDAAIADENVNFFRSGTHRLNEKQIDELKSKLVALASDIGGGSIKYSGKLLRKTHAGMKISDAEINHMVSHLRRALIRNNVKEEDMETILGAIKVIRRDIVAPKEDVPVVDKSDTMWERLGGEAVVTKVVNDWIDACVEDKRVNFFREGKRKLTPEQIAGLKEKMVRLASALTKGPLEYRGRNLKEAHRSLGITGAEFDAMIAHLKVSMVKNGLKEAEMDFVLKAIEAVKESVVQAEKK